MKSYYILRKYNGLGLDVREKLRGGSTTSAVRILLPIIIKDSSNFLFKRLVGPYTLSFPAMDKYQHLLNTANRAYHYLRYHLTEEYS